MSSRDIYIDKEKLSDCCGAPPLGGIEEYGFCGECQEHTEFYTETEEEIDELH